MLRPLRHVLWAGLIGLIGEAAAAPCDPLVGEFLMEFGKEEIQLRIERSDGRYFVRLDDGRGQWREQLEALQEVPLDELKGLVPDVECGLGGGGGVFVKTAVGGARLADNPAEKGHEVGYALTGFLMVIPQGFSISVFDLFPLADHTGAAEPRVEPSPERAVAGVMRCPGDRAPDLTQASYDALPKYMKDNIQEGQPLERRTERMCGQRLVRSIDSRYAKGAYAKIHGESLQELRSLLEAGQVPRDDKGVSQWWELGKVLLTYHGDGKPSEDPLAATSSAIFLNLIVPHLTQESLKARPVRLRALGQIVTTLAGRSDADAREALARMKAAGLPVHAQAAAGERG
ncbi:hypothetical protein [Azoarcus olearius]|uniref:hypothetical protein n=1 Tax=Azoarcus sp. (strain BH72) TaxID=418699 RepID=UPI0002E6B377|nr:hypothetical protein [Azoarcus olearius]